MNLVFISDTHGKHKQTLREALTGDIIFHSGDFVGDHNSVMAYELFFKWYSELNFTHRILIAGNHDMHMENTFKKQYLYDNYGITYLCNETVELEGIKIYGSPHTPHFYNWFFTKSRGRELEEIWKKIPEDTDILLTHGPPFGIGDNVRNELTGCIDLLHRVLELNLKIHSFGHIHEGYGMYRAPQAGVFTKFLNSSILNGTYQATNRPHTITYDHPSKSPLLEG